MLIFIIIFCIFILSSSLYLRKLSKDYYLWAPCKRLKTLDGSRLADKVYIVPGRTVFGNNFDIVGSSPEQIFYWCRDLYRRTNGKPYILNFFKVSVYSITSPEDVQEVLQSQTLIAKGIIYELVRPFLGDGLLVSTGDHWHSRRKLLTPAFHFNILQNFLEVFTNESTKLVKLLQSKDEIVNLNDVIPEFTLNNICETALGVSLDDIPGSKEYRHTIHNLELMMVKRLCNPLLYFELIFYLFEDYKGFYRDLKVAHDFSGMIIQKKREEYRSKQRNANDVSDETGKRKRYAMLDTLFNAESKGIIDHQGICDEVNTFMFEGYDTTSTCLIFALLNLATHQDIQEKCYREVEKCDLPNLSIFDFNQLEYVERVIKETLRLYPSVPFISRRCMQHSELNGLILPPDTEINIHIYDIMRDERHFPDPLKFDPDRFLPQNSIDRHPFAFVPFSAGSRNCIGQKFAMLEIKAILVGILQNFQLLPATRLQDIRFENGLVLRTKENVLVKMIKRSK
ncbi:probable cytochrome P450 4ac1 [Rhagoletis pomonella]|uniref:probable cytochrome P450 4ac1 n=1 Tax=Rhagoletis pomonella TaxID=28610 RepID=UPI0017807E54|nr:probable cytochrome P450 4ac1 [Rhagoletis pomonella]